MENLQNGNAQNSESEKSLQELLHPYITRWYYIAVSVMVFLIGGYLYLRYSSPEYKSIAKILLKDESRGQSSAEIQIFQDLGIGSASGNVDNELEILKSRTLMLKVCDSLNLNVSYIVKGCIKNSEIYQGTPVFLHVENYTGSSGKFVISLQTDGKFYIKECGGEYTTVINAGQKAESPWGLLSVAFSGYEGDYPVIAKVGKWNGQRQISVNNANKNSGVVEISMISPTPEKSEDIIDVLIDFYNNQVIDDKKWVTEQTIDFINNRLVVILEQLDDVEKDVESYKKKYELIDLQAEASMYLLSGSEYDKRIADIELQKEILGSLEVFLSDENNWFSPVPSSLGINNDFTLTALMDDYNKLQLERRQLSTVMREGNPQLVEIESRLALLRNDLLRGLKNAERGYDVTLDNLKRKEDSYSSKIRNLSTNEREIQGYLRQKEITESIFLYLLQKREESAISLQMATPNAKIIDKAYTEDVPVKPRKMIIMFLVLMLGLLVPVGLIYLLELLNTKLRSKEDIEAIAKAPVLGEVPEKTTKSDIVVEAGDRSGIVEIYRLLATNLRFMLTGKDDKVVIITSSVPNEGKSSFSINFALTFSTINKKVLLVDLDMRNSNMNDTLDIHGAKGMSAYLSDRNLKPQDVIHKSKLDANLDVALSGIYPPNPVKLLMGDRLEEFFTYARAHYDLIIIDSPPVFPVIDSIIIDRVSDATIYVTRAGVTRKQFLRKSEELYRDKKLKNLSYVIKGIVIGKKYDYRYGYGYGYGYGLSAKKKWYEIWKK